MDVVAQKGGSLAAGLTADGHGRPVKLTPSRRVYGLGAILLVSLFIVSRNFSRMGDPSFLVPLAVAGIAYLLAIREFFSTPKFPPHLMAIGLALAAVWHFQFLRMPPGFDDDIHRYVWDGRVQRLGYNPYILVPSDPAFAGLHTSETRTLNNPEVPSPYLLAPGASAAGSHSSARPQGRQPHCIEDVTSRETARINTDTAISSMLTRFERPRPPGRPRRC